MFDQDWTPVVIRKPKPAPTAPAPRAPATMTPTGKPAWKIEDNEEKGKPLARVASDVGKELARMRTEAKLSQRDLDAELCLPKGTVNSIESGKSVENKALVNRIKAFLERRCRGDSSR
jgi:ribosome-binding protein aMBF1 (putative translation factor)